jgi:hypothetical protein
MRRATQFISPSIRGLYKLTDTHHIVRMNHLLLNEYNCTLRELTRGRVGYLE